MRILLIEDEADLREVLKDALVTKGYEVTEAGDGREARNILQKSAGFDVIVSDIRIPYLSGVELLHLVKRNKPTIFILMTGFADTEDTKKAYAVGADDFLQKPFSTASFLESIERCLAKKAKKP